MIRDTAATDQQIQAPNRKRYRVAMTALLLLVLAGGSWAAWPALSRWASADRSVPLAQLRVATVTRGPFVNEISAQGRLVAAVAPTLYAPAPGIVSLHVRAGDTVVSGQLLAQIDSPTLRSRADTARNSLDTQRVALEQARVTARTRRLRLDQAVELAAVQHQAAQRELARNEEAFGEGIVSRQTVDSLRDALATAAVNLGHARNSLAADADTIRLELRAIELEVERQAIAVAELDRQVDALTIRAPIDGMVGTVSVEHLAAVAESSALLSVVDLSEFEIEASVPENYAAVLAPGLPSTITYRNAEYSGQLTAIAPDVQSGSVSIQLRFSSPQPAEARQNQRVSVKLLLDARDDVLQVPRGPFVDDGAGRFAYRVDNAVATRTPVQLGARSLSAVEVLGGLTEGDQIVISGSDRFDRADTILLTQ